MKMRFKYYLTDQVYGILTVDLSLPREQQNLAESLGMSAQEQGNLVGQEMQTIRALLGNSDEA